MTTTEQTRYHAEVVVVLAIDVDATSAAEAEESARRIACKRQQIRRSDIRNLVVRPLTVLQQLTADNVALWQETEALTLGTSSQRDRYRDRCLPEPELLLLARGELFRPFALIPRRTRKGPSAIPHPTDDAGGWTCTPVNGTIPIEWSTAPDPTLGEDHWRTLNRIVAATEEVRRHRWMAMSAPTCVRVEVREHRGRCLQCGGRMAEPSALVEVDWAGRTLSREYSL